MSKNTWKRLADAAVNYSFITDEVASSIWDGSEQKKQHSQAPSRGGGLWNYEPTPSFDGLTGAKMTVKSSAVVTGVSFGSALAISMSWSAHHDIFMAIVHGILGWLYVLFCALS